MEWFNEEEFLKFIALKKNRKYVLNLLEHGTENYEEDYERELKDQAAITIKDPLDLKRIQSYLKTNNEAAYILWMIGQNTGCRGSDIVKLTVGDIRKAIKNRKMILIEEKIEHITQARIRNNRPVKKKTTKEIKRIVNLNKKLIEILKEFIYGKDAHEFLYPTSSKTGHIRRDSLGRIYKKALVELKIATEDDIVGTHTPRKTFGYIQYNEHNQDINYVQNLFCHSSPKTTRVYIGLDEDTREDAADTMDKYSY